MKVGIYTPFPPSFGGGERYCLTIAEILSQNNEVYFISQFKYDLSLFSNVFNLDLRKISFLKKDGAGQFYFPSLTKGYDLFICLSNHIIPPTFSWGKRSLLVVQFPFPFPQKKIGDKLQILLKNFKSASYNLIVCYSRFAKKWTKKFSISNKRILVLSPPIDTSHFVSIWKRGNRILSVGRFFKSDHEKKYFELISTFKKMVDEGLLGWSYHIAGGVTDQRYFERVKQAILGYPIFLHPNISGEKLRVLYGQAKIFWHAAGLFNNENKTPWKSEHFGMAVLEAMSAGFVPVVTNKGALPEFVKHGENGFLFKSLEELKKWTSKLIDDDQLRKNLSNNAVKTAKKFDKKIFERKLLKIIERLMI